jgi:hypothetical protein
MGQVVWNNNHKATQRSKTLQPKYDPRSQTRNKYVYELRTASLLLDHPLSEFQLIEQFTLGLPASVAKQVHTMSGIFDEVVARTGRFDNVGKAGC